MKKTHMTKRETLLIISILAIGFSIRLFGAFNETLVNDEIDHFKLAQNISVSNIPIGSTEIDHPLLSLYLLRLGLFIFGKTVFAGRSLFVFSNFICLVITYLLCKKV